MKNLSVKSVIEYLLVSLSGILFILQCSSWTSPLYPYAYGYDSSWYSLMGRAITKGKVPYRDYFDLKGPVLFFYEAFGQLFIKNRGGIFLIQCISISLTVMLLWKAAGLFLNRFGSALVLALYYYVSYALIWGGNSVEELFMPFSMAAVYLTLNYIKNREKAFFPPGRAALIMGLGFGVCLYSKVTVAAVIVSSALTVIIILIRDKEYKAIGTCALQFMEGILIVSVPIFIYFIVNGALYDFIYCAFLFAFKRSTDYYEPFSLHWELSLMICYAAVFYGLWMKHVNRSDDDRRLYIIILGIIQFLLLHLGTPYLYYFLVQLPVFTVMAIYFFKDVGDKITEVLQSEVRIYVPELRDLAIFLAISIVIVNYWALTSDKFLENIMIYEDDHGKNQVLDCREIYQLVPEWERSDIFNLESGMIYYEVTQTLPTNKYPVNLPYFLHLDPQIKTNVMERLERHTPKWIISERMWDFDDEDVKNFVFSNYELVADNDGEELYRMKD
ncbi:MAG: glycosyltransferase family 39 protein [Lachnospiraceae bacterium]|nr:glycosyltransferase family 39 protein [Lachnospiraceae bacterium]